MDTHPVAQGPSVGGKLESLHQYFEREILEIDRELVAYLDRFDHPPVHYGMIRYHFGYADSNLKRLPATEYLARGKRLRPLICMLFCRMFKLPADVSSIVMMATEVMHSASLAHDDIEDRDAVRWGRPTIHSLFGLEQAINLGDALIGMVYQVLLTLRSHGVPPAKIVDLIDVFNQTHIRMCQGQHLDMRYRYFDDVSIDEYLDMVSQKTASPCVCIADAISVLTDAQPPARQVLRQFGESLGVLYQVCDDFRGIWCEPGALGRQIGQDVTRERASLPLLYAFQRGSQQLRDVLRKCSKTTEPLPEADIALIRHELEACGASRFCRDQATKHYRAAVAALEALGPATREVAVLHAILGAAFASVEFGA
jgi:geranylgeranyl pyrophosphate synthase